jgi:hypothetical protein
MFGRQQWTLFADFLLTRSVPRKNICFDSRPYFRYSVVYFFCTILTPSKILASVSPFSRDEEKQVPLGNGNCRQKKAISEYLSKLRGHYLDSHAALA